MEASQSQRQNPPEQEALTEEAAIAALVVILLSDLPLPEMQTAAAALLAPLGIGAAAVEAALAFIYRHLRWVDLRELEPNTALVFIARTLPVRQAAYVLRAARRLTVKGTTIEAERRYLRQHLNAERVRREVAQRIDAAAKHYGPILGWRAVMDRRTTPECRANHRKNFSALKAPAVGWPGTLHGGACRCWPGPPRPGAQMLP